MAPGGPGGRGPVVPVNLPASPTAVTMPTVSEEITGPGPMFDSTPSLPPGKGLSAFQLRGQGILRLGHGQRSALQDAPRRPPAGAERSTFSGLVLAESMHGSGSAHMFEFTSTYTMTSGHAAVEILTTSPAQFVQHEPGALQGPAGCRRAGAARSSRRSARWCAPASRSAASKVRKMVLGGHVDERRHPSSTTCRRTACSGRPRCSASTTASMPTSNGALVTRTSTCRSCTCRRCSKWRRRTSPDRAGQRRAGQAVPAVSGGRHGAHRHARQRAPEAEPVHACR